MRDWLACAQRSPPITYHYAGASVFIRCHDGPRRDRAPTPQQSPPKYTHASARLGVSANPQPAAQPGCVAQHSRNASHLNQQRLPRPIFGPSAVSWDNQPHQFTTTILTRYTTHARNLGLALRATGPPLHPRNCAGGSSPALPSARTAPRLAENSATNTSRFLSGRPRHPLPHSTSFAAHVPRMAPHPFVRIQSSS
jgi:hypothetical protein